MSDALQSEVRQVFRTSFIVRATLFFSVPFFVLVEASFLYRYPEARAQFLEMNRRLLLGLCLFGSVCYGPWRVARFHPYLDHDYRDWLKRTPWRWPLPLPLGPVTLGWRDVFVLGGLSAAVGLLGEPQWMWLPPAIAVWLYCVCVFPFSWLSFWTGNAMSIALAAVWIVGPWGLPLVYVAAYFAVRKSLEEFHRMTRQVEDPNRVLTKLSTVGWPHASLHPRKTTLTKGHGLALLLSVHVAWWVFVAIVGAAGTPFIHSPSGEGFGAVSLYALVAGGVRLLMYDLSSPPIDLWGRWTLRRWIIWDYDRVFLPSIGVVALSAALAVIVPGICPWPAFSVPVAIGLVTYLTIVLPPSPTEWELTGGQNLRGPAITASSELMQTQ